MPGSRAGAPRSSDRAWQHSYEAEGSYGKAISGVLASDWGLIVSSKDGNGHDNLRAEMKALVAALPTPDARGGAG